MFNHTTVCPCDAIDVQKQRRHHSPLFRQPLHGAAKTLVDHLQRALELFFFLWIADRRKHKALSVGNNFKRRFRRNAKQLKDRLVDDQGVAVAVFCQTFNHLASPFSYPDSEVRRRRFEAVCRAAAELIGQGRSVFSPIAHSYEICAYGLPLDWQFWQKHDRRYLEVCDEAVVLMLDGWQESIGVQAEINIARELNKPVSFLQTKEMFPESDRRLPARFLPGHRQALLLGAQGQMTPTVVPTADLTNATAEKYDEAT